MKSIQVESVKIKKKALIISISLLVMTFSAFFSYGYVLSTLLKFDIQVPTMEVLIESTNLYKAGI